MTSGIFTLKQQQKSLLQGSWQGQKTPAVDYLVVAGGGGGGYLGGGGGGGGLLQGNLPVATGTAITVTVGAGGGDTTTGSNSVFSSITASGGGGGGPYGNTATDDGKSGGSGGGGAGKESASPATVGGQGTLGQGNAGGAGPKSGAEYRGAGGGGAGTVGLATTANAGAGGSGIASNISGARTVYAGGGGGAADSSGIAGLGGVGGGGAGGASRGATGGSGSINGANGTANTGGGGGGYGVSGTAGSGGSGIVIISYPDVYPAAASTTGSPTVSTSGSGAISFSGTSQYLQYADNAAFTMGSGDFTIECWVYRNATGEMYITGQCNSGGTNSTASFVMLMNSSNQLSGGIISSSTFYLATASTSFTNSTWTHIALVRDGNTLRIYSGGTQVGTASVTGITANDSSNRLGVGCFGEFLTSPFNGYITNFRIVKGTCLYPSGTTFTPSTTPLTAISGTSLLLPALSGSFSADFSTNGFFPAALGDATYPTWTDSSPFSVTGYKNRVYKWTSSGSITF